MGDLQHALLQLAVLLAADAGEFGRGLEDRDGGGLRQFATSVLSIAAPVIFARVASISRSLIARALRAAFTFGTALALNHSAICWRRPMGV
jgi:hypothetical protein